MFVVLKITSNVKWLFKCSASPLYCSLWPHVSMSEYCTQLKHRTIIFISWHNWHFLCENSCITFVHNCTYQTAVWLCQHSKAAPGWCVLSSSCSVEEEDDDTCTLCIYVPWQRLYDSLVNLDPLSACKEIPELAASEMMAKSCGQE